MIALLSLAGALLVSAIGVWIFRRWEAGLERAMQRHAMREAIRQESHLDRWAKGEMPLTEPQVDKGLARRIAHRKLKPGEVLRFRAGGER